jgi:hypothetical protein
MIKTAFMKRLLPLLLLFSSCDPFDARISQLTGYVPVYATRDAVNTITVEPARATTHPGKVYAYGVYLFQIEQNEGIHIIDKSNPKTANKIAFLKVPMATEIAIKSGQLYTNNLNDLVVFDISTITAPKLVNRIKDAFPAINQEYPPFSNTYFECPDPSKGIVVGWELKDLNNPKCRR